MRKRRMLGFQVRPAVAESVRRQMLDKMIAERRYLNLSDVLRDALTKAGYDLSEPPAQSQANGS